MKLLVLAAAPLALLVGCSGPSDGVEPGQWEFTVRPVSMEAPEAPEEVRQAMQAQLDSEQAQTTSECITPAEAASFADSLGRFSGNDDCDIEESDVGDGNIMMRGTCTVPGAAGSSPITMDGSYERESLQADITLEMNAPPLGPVTILAEMTGERTGDCDA